MDALEKAGVSPHARHIIADAGTHTYFHTNSLPTVAATLTGTKVGDPLADLVFMNALDMMPALRGFTAFVDAVTLISLYVLGVLNALSVLVSPIAVGTLSALTTPSSEKALKVLSKFSSSRYFLFWSL